jgi:hypothetical protein
MKRMPDKYFIKPLCETYGVNMLDARVVIQHERKVGFIINYGDLPTSIGYFVREFPTASQKEEFPGGRLCLVPNGYKCAGVVHGRAYLGEVAYDEHSPGMLLRSYRFHRVEDGKITKSGDFKETPSQAFSQLHERDRDRIRYNGKLYLGVMYTAVQNALRQAFVNAVVPDEVLPVFTEWMNDLPSGEGPSCDDLLSYDGNFQF